MITLPRKRIRSIRTMMSQALGITSRKSQTPIGFHATGNIITLTASNQNIGIQHNIHSDAKGETFAVPLAALAACEGRGNDAVSFRRDKDTIIVEWCDAGIPQMARHDVLENPEMPADVKSTVVCDPSLMPALADAVTTADREATRYAVNCLQLRGDGQILATDGRQAYVHCGFEFPWSDDLLVPASRVLLRKEFVKASDCAIGASGAWLQLRAGAWEIWLKINQNARFPAVDDHVPGPHAATTTLNLDEGDAEFLVKALTRLPGARASNAPVTLDLNGQVAVRAKDDEQITQLDLCRSSKHGQEVRCNTNRIFLVRAAQLGFREVHFHGPENPAVCRAGNRTYFWALLGKDGAIKAAKNMQHIASSDNSEPQSTRLPKVERPSMQSEKPHESASDEEVASSATPLEAAEALRDSLKESLTRSRHLIATLRRSKKQSRLVENTLASLRQLQDAG